MATDNFSNIVNASGYVNDDTVATVILSDPVTTVILDGLTVTKTADRNTWVNGILQYTITIDNQSGSDYNNITITDQLGFSENDLVWIALVENSVMMEGSAVNHTYNTETGLLTISPIPDLNVANGETVSITFQVEKQVPTP